MKDFRVTSSDVKINATIAGHCLVFAGWRHLGDRTYESNGKVFKIWGQVSRDDCRIIEVDDVGDPIGNVYCAKTIGEFRDVVQLLQKGAKQCQNPNHPS